MLRNMIFPVTTLLSLCGLFCFWGLPAAVVMHMNANAVSNAIFEPVKTLNYAAIPYRMLGQVRMLAEGVIYPAGIALSGIGLLWLQSMAEPRTTLLVDALPRRPVRRRLRRRRRRLPAQPAAQPPPARGGSRRPDSGAGHEPVFPGRHAGAGKPSRPAGQALCRRVCGTSFGCRAADAAGHAAARPLHPDGGARPGAPLGGNPSGGGRGAGPLRRRRHRRSGCSGCCHPGRRWRMPPSWRSARSDRRRARRVAARPSAPAVPAGAPQPAWPGRHARLRQLG